MAAPRYLAVVYLLTGVTGGALLGVAARAVFLALVPLDPVIGDLVFLVLAIAGAYKGLAAALRVLRRT